MKLTIKIDPVKVVPAHTKHEMFEVFEKYYDFTTFGQFIDDLRNKTHVILLHDNNSLVGFSTVFWQVQETGETILFSGDTILEKAYWGTKLLQRAFYKLMFSALKGSRGHPVYWMLMSKGYKTYLLMRRNFAVSFPNYKNPIPAKFEELRDRFYENRFASNYFKEKGLVQYKSSLGQLKKGIAEPMLDDLTDMEIRFFVQANPYAAKGDELACIAQIRWRDLLITGIKHLFKWRKISNQKQEGGGEQKLKLNQAATFKNA